MITQAQIDAVRNRLADWHALYGTIPNEAIAAALTAAREVTPLIWDEQKVREDTIDRCAEVAERTITEENSWADGRARNIARRIRAMKDKP